MPSFGIAARGVDPPLTPQNLTIDAVEDSGYNGALRS